MLVTVVEIKMLRSCWFWVAKGVATIFEWTVVKVGIWTEDIEIFSEKDEEINEDSWSNKENEIKPGVEEARRKKFAGQVQQIVEVNNMQKGKRRTDNSESQKLRVF